MKNPHNLLNDETSPYLLQHAGNPVNWHPWGETALEKARHENRPILLSIGYSACHWCHVMAHESFENNDIASIMNKHFINIKVDREERPDLDKIYQTAHSLLTSRPGGWPLTVFLSPRNQMPFFAGTYFPDEPRHNMPSFPEILQLTADAYKDKQTEIEQQNIAIADALKSTSEYSQVQTPLSSLPLDLARKQLGSAFDKAMGGFSGAPKFPHPHMLERCIRHHLFLKSQGKNDLQALQMADFTLRKMALGGFQDQLGGGFFRYSTDEAWMIPHFEKMLYDNAQLFTLYAQAFCVTGDVLYSTTIEHAADWLIREMQTEQGGYCSALDADTDKVEGKTYVWTPQQISALLSDEEYAVCEQKYALTKPANFEGSWHLHSTIDNTALARQLKLDPGKLSSLLESASQKLLAHRNTRPQPGRDDKILCSWNALMIRGMCQIGQRTAQPLYIESAIQSADFIYSTLWQNHRLLAGYKDNKAHLNAYLDDYAYLLQALLELLQCQWSNRNYHWAIEIADTLLEYFEDKNQGGFYFTSHDHEQLLYRSKTFSDDAMPNGNSIAATALLQLGLLSGETRYLSAAEKTIRCSYSALNEHAISHCSMQHALELYLSPGLTIILRGKKALLQQWKKLTEQRFIPQLLCLAIENDADLPESLQSKKPLGEICAYICEGTQCRAPVTDFDQYLDYINSITQHEH